MAKYRLFHFKSLTSTQDKGKELAKKGLRNIVIVADIQTKGRGRFRRKWHSDKNGLWMSILLKPKNVENLQYMTFAASVAVVEAIKKTANLKTSIKWPNDVHCNGKKLCGILTESSFGKKNHVVVGIGLNVNQIEFPDEIKSTAVSLRMIKHRVFDIKKIMGNIADNFFDLYNNCCNKNKAEKILKIWKKYCDTIRKNVVITTKTKKIAGKAIGVDADCSLLLKQKNGKTIKIVEGDVNVRY